MFGKDAGLAGESKLNSIVGKGSNCEGEIVVAGGLKIDGNFRGHIKADSVFVGKEAALDATIDTNVAVIGGKVVGDVVARQSLELQAKAELIGNVQTKNLIIAETAVFDGYCDMGQRERHSKPAAPKAEDKETAKAAVSTGAPVGAEPTALTFVKPPASGAPTPTGDAPSAADAKHK